MKNMNQSEIFRHFMNSYSKDDDKYICDPKLATLFFEEYYSSLGETATIHRADDWRYEIYIQSTTGMPIRVAIIEVEEECSECTNPNHYHPKSMMAYVQMYHPILKEHVNNRINKTMVDFFVDMNNLHPDEDIKSVIEHSHINLEERTINVRIDNHERMESYVYVYDIDDVAILFVKQLTDKLFSNLN